VTTNPYPEFTDPTTWRRAIQHLRPESTHSFGWATRCAPITSSPSLYYRYKTDGFTSGDDRLTDTTFFRTMENLAP
jgi:hypothetical protein